MRTLSGALTTHLAGSVFVLADLFEFVVGGTTYYRTNFDVDLTANGTDGASHTWSSSGAVLPRVRMRSSAGLEVDDLEISVGHGGTGTIGSKTWTRAALDGDLDGATVRLFRAYVNPTTSAVIGTVSMFVGEVSDLEPGSTSLRLVASVPSKRFGARFPALLVEPNCVHDLGSVGCAWAGTLDHATTLIAGSTSGLVKIAALPAGADGGSHLFVQGSATVAGYRRSITTASNVPGEFAFYVSPPFPAGVVEGLIGSAGALTIRRGCLHTPGWCSTYFSNLAHFLGAPMAPPGSEVV